MCIRDSLEGDDRLVAGHLAGGAHEAAAVVDALQVEGDDFGVRVGGHGGQRVRLAHVDLVAEADEMGQAEALAAGPVDDGGADGPGVGQEGHVAGRGAGRRQEGGVQRAVGVDAVSYTHLDVYKRQLSFHEAALAVAREVGDRRGEGTHLGNLGIAYKNLGQVERAIEFYEAALAVAREIGDRRGEGNHLGNLGIAYADLGQVARAIELYEAALAVAREIGDRRGEGNRLGNLGNAYADLGQVERAIEFYEAALAVAREIGDRRNEGLWLGNLGNAYRNLGQVERAIEQYEACLLYTSRWRPPWSPPVNRCRPMSNWWLGRWSRRSRKNWLRMGTDGTDLGFCSNTLGTQSTQRSHRDSHCRRRFNRLQPGFV